MRKIKCFKTADGCNCAFCTHYTGKGSGEVVCKTELSFCTFEASILNIIKAVGIWVS